MDPILVEKADGVLTITFNRPEKKNAITQSMYGDIGGAIAGADSDKEVRCILIQAAGDFFCAGNDIGDFAAVNRGEKKAASERVGRNPLLAALLETNTPIVAAVQGRAIGVGVTMLLHCDLIYIAEDATLTTPFVNLALVPEAASSLLLTQRIGHTRAFAMFALGEAVDGKTAVAWGIANAALPAGEVQARARAAAQAIAARPPSSVSRTKSLMRDAAAILEKMNEERGHFEHQLKSPEAREAFAAFAERRAPDFSKVG